MSKGKRKTIDLTEEARVIIEQLNIEIRVSKGSLQKKKNESYE